MYQQNYEIISYDSVTALANNVQENKFRLLILNGMIVHVHYLGNSLLGKMYQKPSTRHARC